MKLNAFAQVCSPRALRIAWRSMLSKSRPGSRNTVGVDGVSINSFAEEWQTELRKLSVELLAGQFQFSPLRAHLIPKPNGKDRLICVPTVRDRIVQRALLEFLSTKYHYRLANPISYGFVRFRTVADAAELACTKRAEFPWVVKTDISSFFDEIDRDILGRAIRKTIRDRSLHPLLLDALNGEVQEPSVSSTRRIKALGVRRGRGVRQGMPLSPLFANVLLQDFDEAIVDSGLSAIRYADDLIFFAPTRAACIEIFEFCKVQLALIGHSIPNVDSDSKSRIYAPEEMAEFLGLGLTRQEGRYVLKLMPTQIDRIRTDLLQLSSIPELLSRRVTLATLGGYVEARVNGYLAAYEICTNWKEVEENLRALVEKILRSVYEQGLRIDVRALSRAARTFLGLRTASRIETRSPQRINHEGRRRIKRALARAILRGKGVET